MIFLRLLREEDAEQFYSIRLKALEEHPDAFGSSIAEEKNKDIQEIKEGIRPNEDSWIIGAFEFNKLIGMVGWFRQPKEKLKHKSTIWGMYVSTQYKGQGIGKELLSELIGKVKEVKGIEQIQLTVASHNQNAKKLYERFVFETFGYEKKALKDGKNYYDEEHMVLEIVRKLK